MKNIYLLLFCLILIINACNEKDFEIDAEGTQLAKIEVNGKIYQNFEYQNGNLIKENWYSFCETNPSDEYTYTYQNQQLSKINLISRSIYSSTSSVCNPDLGLKSENTFEYDSQNRLIKSNRENSYSEYIYNVDNKVIKQLLHYGSSTLTATYEYDNKGNMIKETNFDGTEIRYEYDNNPNPFYAMRQRPDWISPFNQSPNNVLKSFQQNGGFTRSIIYNTLGYPAKVLENGSQTYEYVYQK
jgi:hypothetical protein